MKAVILALSIVNNTPKMECILKKMVAMQFCIRSLWYRFCLKLTLIISFQVGTSFSLEIEVKPRTKNAVLLSVGVLEYLTLQIINGTIKFSVDNGAGEESVIYSPPANNMLCDGHWHQIKVYSNPFVHEKGTRSGANKLKNEEPL